MAKQKAEETDFSDVSVTLKPIFGINPIHYLPVLYVIIIGLIVFFLLFFPGLTKHGAYITFKTLPDKAPVYIDEKYIGSTPCTAFVKSGKREIEIKKPFYSVINISEQVKGGLFGTLFFPRKMTIARQCELIDVDGLVEWAKKDLANYGMLNDFTANYQFPPLITDAVKAIYGINRNISKKLYNFMHNAMYFVDSEQEFADFLHAFSLFASKGKAFSSFSVIRMIKEIMQYKAMYDGFPCWISGALSKVKPLKTGGKESPQMSPYDAFITTGWFTNYFDAYKNKIKKLKESENILFDERRINIQGISCILVPATTYVMGNTAGLDSSLYPDMENLPHPVSVKSFYISITEITNKDFSAFVKAETRWLPSNREVLENEDLVTGQYLSHWYGDTPDENDLLKPVTFISYYAAVAFCEWLASYLPSGLGTVHLPKEAEWECVAKYIENRITPSLFFSEKENYLLDAGKNPKDTFPVKDIFGSVWEWSDSWYFPKEYTLSTNDSEPDAENFLGSEKVVRGGCWANSRLDNILSSTRGSQPPSWCTPYLGFRVVVSEN